MENKWDIGNFKPPEEFICVCRVCNQLVLACDKCGETVDYMYSISCGEGNGKGHICYSCWDKLHAGEGENEK